MTGLIGGAFVGSDRPDESRLVTPGQIESALSAGSEAFAELSRRDPEDLARFLDRLAVLIDANAEPLAELAHRETSLPFEPRLRDVEISRTTDQLRQASVAVLDRSWRDPILSSQANVARLRQPLPGAVFVLGPNNFPFAFNAVGGGDFAAAIGTGHPVIAKANPGHPETTVELARLARQALEETGLPMTTVQLLVDVEPDDGLRVVSDRRVAAMLHALTAFYSPHQWQTSRGRAVDHTVSQ